MTDSRSPSDPLAELDAAAWLRVRAGGLAAALIVAILLVLGHDAIRQPLYDAYQKLLRPPEPSTEIVVVAIDAPSLREVGGWPWSRYTMARLAEEMGSRGARAIGFDLLFPEADRQNPADFVTLYPELSPAAAAEVRGQASMDDVFAMVIGRSPSVLARFGVEPQSFDNPEEERAAVGGSLLPPEARFSGPQPAAIPNYPAAVASIDALDGAAAGRGLANGPPDRDGIVRRVPLLGRPDGVLTPSLALELVRVAEGETDIRLEGTEGALSAIHLGRHRVPVDAAGRAFLRFTASPRGPGGEKRAAYRTISAVDLLREGLPSDALKGKIVLVGLVAAGTSDVVNTSMDGRTYGVFVQAQAVDAILRSSALRVPVWAALVEWGLSVGLVMLAWWGVPRSPLWVVSAIAFMATAAAVGASGLAFQANVLLNPIPMLAPAAATALTTVTILFVEGRRVQSRLRYALENERLSAARAAGELAAATEIQMGMLLPRESLGRITPKVEIDAVLIPAREVGGDLYDAFMIDEQRLCFLVGDVTGKGVPASLFMALSKALSRSLLMRPGTDLASAVEGINAELSRDNGQAMAVSLLVGVLHVENGRLDLCSAGHENPILIAADGTAREIALDGGPPLCVADDFPYPVETHRLGPGETLVVLTDGVTEAQTPDGDLFGRARALESMAGHKAPREVVDELVAAVHAFEAGGEPSDDVTVLALRLSGR